MNEMVIKTPTSDNGINDNRHNQRSTCTLPAAIWRLLPQKEKEVLVSATLKQPANERNTITWNDNNAKSTQKILW